MFITYLYTVLSEYSKVIKEPVALFPMWKNTSQSNKVYDVSKIHYKKILCGHLLNVKTIKLDLEYDLLPP